jgi:hypothetical protein
VASIKWENKYCIYGVLTVRAFVASIKWENKYCSLFMVFFERSDVHMAPAATAVVASKEDRCPQFGCSNWKYRNISF